MKKKRIASTFLDGFDSINFAKVASAIDVPPYFEILPRQKFRPWLEFLLFWRVLKAATSHEALLLFSSRGHLKPEIMACVFIGLWPKKFQPTILLYGEMYEPSSGLSNLIERLVIRLADRAISLYLVYSTEELDLFPTLWNIAPQKMRFLPFYIRKDRTKFNGKKRVIKDHVFAGGNSKRDYAPVIKAAEKLPEIKFIFGTKTLENKNDLLPNIRADWMKMDEYVALMNTARVVLVPLKTGNKRTTGLLTALEALSLEKVIVAPDALGIRDYILNGKSGIIVDGTPESYVKAIQWALDPENKVAVSKMCKEARRSTLEVFTLDNHSNKILNFFEQALKQRKSSSL
ncbi:MAG: glycosyltransferase family 4 protein [Anaerolineae bacterium]|nr:glycosyltransferase family 4 protein [Anaerolineae bacterium]MBT7192220.1 glycosyltransferase family 4 protein [Anaerolineae bacterium]MBT7989633.1 glycosyltransferase family 4 protein [Anaerolineae bacterium]